jgi:hypothetical protein
MLNVRRGVRGMFARDAWAAGPQGAGWKDQPPRYSVWTVLHQPPALPQAWAPPMSDRLVTPASQEPSLFGQVILTVQRRWVLAKSLSSAFEAKGARVLLANTADSGVASADHPHLAAAVLDGQSLQAGEEKYSFCRVYRI